MDNTFDPTEPVGHKWTLTALWKYLAAEVRRDTDETDHCKRNIPRL